MQEFRHEIYRLFAANGFQGFLDEVLCAISCVVGQSRVQDNSFGNFFVINGSSMFCVSLVI